MFKFVLGLPMRLVLGFKLKGMRKVLEMAEEQQRDAALLGCIRCITSESGCTGDKQCGLDKFNNNVALARTEVAELEHRIRALQ